MKMGCQNVKLFLSGPLAGTPASETVTLALTNENIPRPDGAVVSPVGVAETGPADTDSLKPDLMVR